MILSELLKILGEKKVNRQTDKQTNKHHYRKCKNYILRTGGIIIQLLLFQTFKIMINVISESNKTGFFFKNNYSLFLSLLRFCGGCEYI